MPLMDSADRDLSQDEKELAALHEQETKVELDLIGDSIIGEEDIVPSSRDLRSLCTLYSSLVRCGRHIASNLRG
jgi:hypothetical protein